MKKLLFVFLVLIAGAFLGVYFYLGSVVREVVETRGTEALGVPVTLGSASVMPFSGSGKLTELTIANPEGFEGPHAFRLGRLDVNVDTGTLMEDTVVVHSISIDSPDINYVMNREGANLQRIVSWAQNARSNEGTAGDRQVSEAPSSGKKVIIERLTIRNASVTMDVNVGQESVVRDITLDEIVLTDIGKATNGATAKQIAQVILQEITKQLENKGMTGIRGQVKQEIRSKVQDRMEQKMEGLDPAIQNKARELLNTVPGMGE